MPKVIDKSKATKPVKKVASKKKTAKKPISKKTTTNKKTATSKRTTTSTWLKITKTRTILNPHGKKLLIVESPWKVKTISKYLGSQYVVKASVGHIVDLVDKNMSKLIDKWFEPEYEIDPQKKKVVTELRAAAKASSEVILATDKDREWEAIWYHLVQVLGLDPKNTPRIVFNEITKPALEEALQKPWKLDMDLINAQKSRAVLDKLVWFSVSPILWQKIKMWLSAGRVQSVAVKLVVEREREIERFQPVEYWILRAVLETPYWDIEIGLQKIEWVAHIEETKDSEDPKDKHSDKEKLASWRFAKAILDKVLHELRIQNPESSLDDKTWFQILTDYTAVQFQLVDITTKQSKKSPPPPFITSSLQQTASRMFGRPVKQVMSAAQKLYEAWLITYMRTDSTNLSGTAIAQCKEYIIWKYGVKYSTVRQFKSKSKNAQEAHEAIRPTTIDTIPETVSLGQYEQRLYSLIRKRTLASQMSDALFTNTSYIFHPIIS